MTRPTVRVRRVMPAAPEAVFDEWLDPDALMDWMCPRPTHCVAVTVEPEGGSDQPTSTPIVQSEPA